MMASSKQSFVNVLAEGSGSSIVVVVGGADEAVETTNGEIRLVLEKRKGFVREAMMAGAKLVPVLAFGENDLYDVQHFAPDHLVTQIQKFIKKSMTFSAPVFVSWDLVKMHPHFPPTIHGLAPHDSGDEVSFSSTSALCLTAGQ